MGDTVRSHRSFHWADTQILLSFNPRSLVFSFPKATNTLILWVRNAMLFNLVWLVSSLLRLQERKKKMPSSLSLLNFFKTVGALPSRIGNHTPNLCRRWYSSILVDVSLHMHGSIWNKKCVRPIFALQECVGWLTST